MHTVPWWKRTTVYQIYPRSFADGNGDGIGDLQGVISRLDYLRDLGIETLWISPFFDSPQADFGYDVRDYYAVSPEYGSLADVRALIDEVHTRGMKVIFDLVLNHTSDQHPWFIASRSSRNSPLRDYYLWRDGRDRGRPPNNWRSMLGGSGWQYDAQTEQWYWASFLPFQPDLNYRNPAVKSAMLDVVRHWLREGVDGFRLDIFNAIYKGASFANNPWSARPFPTADNPHGFFQRHVHTIDHPDTIRFARELRAVIDEYQDPPRFVVGEVFGSASDLRRYVGSEEEANGLHLVFLFKTLSTRLEASALRELLEDIERHFADPFTPTYVLGNHDRPRFIHRLGGDHDKAKLLATLQLTARGVPFIYYGEEIGMRHPEAQLREPLDPVAARYGFVPTKMARLLQRFGILLNRDECRLPMQWEAGPHAGFSPNDASPWLPVHPHASHNNVASQREDEASLLNHYRRLLALRKQSAALSAGHIELFSAAELPRDVLAYRRVLKSARGAEQASVYLNLSTRRRSLRMPGSEPDLVLSSLRPDLRSVRSQTELLPFESLVVVHKA